MYKSLIGAFGLLSLLLMLCSSNTQVAARGIIARQQAPLATLATQTRLTDTTSSLATTMTDTFASVNLVVQNQRIVALSPQLAQEVMGTLANKRFQVQPLYPLDDGKVAILLSKQSGEIDQEIESTLFSVLKSRTQPTNESSMLINDDELTNYVAKAVHIPTLLGNPHSIGAAPLDIPITFDGQPGNLLLKQWALAQLFNNNGSLALYDPVDGRRAVPEAGQDVRIVLFDTSPFSFTEGMSDTAIFTTPFRVSDFPTLTIKVTKLDPAFQVETEAIHHHQPEPTAPQLDIRNHGLFAAALAYAVAPAAKIELVQVLNHQGEGTVAALTTHLHRLITESKTSSISTVINLSLGVLGEIPTDDDDLKELLNVISATRQLTNVVIVAAAGNFTQTGSMQWPANHPAVIGVGASNARGNLACFSRRIIKSQGPRIAAPGGDALLNTLCDAERVRQRCMINQKLVGFLEALYSAISGQTIPNSQRYTCSNLLIGLIFDPTTNTFQYGYWMGTSFATPIISGLVALQLQSESSNSVYESFMPGTPLGAAGDVKEPTPQECLPRYDAKHNRDSACPI